MDQLPTWDQLSGLLTTLAPYLTVAGSVFAAYAAFRNQQRLKAFELFHARRMQILDDVDATRESITRLLSGADMFDLYLVRAVQDAIVLQRKIMSGSFGREVDNLAVSFVAIVTESIEGIHLLEKGSWLTRQTNVLALISGSAHARVSWEMESMSRSVLSRSIRRIRRWWQRRFDDVVRFSHKRSKTKKIIDMNKDLTAPRSQSDEENI